jgi:GNAT superfamily N-acetyltransferase
MAGWAGVYNGAFAGEWRFSPHLDIGMHAFVFTGGRFSLAAVDGAGNTVALALARLENRPHDYLPQPVGNVWVLCTTANRRREGIGEGLLRAVLINLRAAGALSATIQSDLDSQFGSYRLYERVGFRQAGRFCVRTRRF